MRWMILTCVSKPSCAHGTIVSLWLICCIQCGFSICYLSIPGIVAHDRSNISQYLILFVQFHVQCRAVPFIYINVYFVFNRFYKCMYCFTSLFFMPQVKDQQSHSLHLILVYFIFVTTIFRLFLNFVILL